MCFFFRIAAIAAVRKGGPRKRSERDQGFAERSVSQS